MMQDGKDGQSMLGRWLAAEAAGEDRVAEAALNRLFQRLPRPRPRPGFASRVMAAAALAPLPAPAPAGAALRWLVLAAAALAALALPLRLPLLLGLVSWIGPAEVLAALGGGVVTLADGLHNALSLAAAFADVQRALLGVLARPAVSLTLLAAVVVVTFAYRWLADQLTASRSLTDVPIA